MLLLGMIACGGPRPDAGGTTPKDTAGSASDTARDTARDPDSAPPDPSPSDTGLALAGPIERDGRYVLELGDTWFEVDPARGARISRFAVGGVDVLFVADEEAWGSTFWTSPQSDWGWPPVAALDDDPWSVSVEGDSIVLVSAPVSLAGTTLVAEKRFSPDLAHEGIRLDYTLRNTGDSTVSVAPWEVTRVASDGLVLFPQGASARSMTGSFPYTESGGYVWFDASYAGASVKLAADGSSGWVASVSSSGTVLVKVFDDVPVADQAPGEGEIELYSAGTYVEVEEQGPYAALASGEESTWTVRWYGRSVAERVAVGDADLAARIAGVVGELPPSAGGRGAGAR